jgi:hypothetical protein
VSNIQGSDKERERESGRKIRLLLQLGAYGVLM